MASVRAAAAWASIMNGAACLGQHRVFGHADDVLDAFGVQPVEQCRSANAPSSRTRRRRGAEGAAEQSTQAPDQRARADGRRRVAGPQQRRAQILLRLVIKGQKRQERQVTPRVVVPMKERQLLRAVRRVVRHIEIDRDATRAPAQPLAMAIDHGGRQRAADAIQRTRPDAIFKPRDRGLRGEGLPLHRIAVEQQLLDRIVGEPVGIVAIGIAGGDAEDALREHVRQRMRDAGRVAGVRETGRQPRRQIQAAVGRLQQDRATVPTGVRLIEDRDEGLGEEVWEENSLWYRVVGQIKRLRSGKSYVATAFYHAEAFVYYRLSFPDE